MIPGEKKNLKTPPRSQERPFASRPIGELHSESEEMGYFSIREDSEYLNVASFGPVKMIINEEEKIPDSTK